MIAKRHIEGNSKEQAFDRGYNQAIDEMEEQGLKRRRIKETILEMIDEDYDLEDIRSYINQHI